MTEREILTRSYALELAEGEGREIYGRCVPYGVAATVSDDGGATSYSEQFEPGAFAGAVKAPDRVTLNYRHSLALGDQIGRAVSFEEQADGLYGTFRAFGGQLGDHAMAMVKEGALRGLSVGFAVLGRSRPQNGDLVRRTRCHLAHVGLIPEHEKSFPEAEVLAVRARVQALRPPRNADLDERLRALGLLPAD
jgi:HK97 family phage prohead protease